MTPHPHAKIIKAWADGHKIQFRTAPDAEWLDVQNHSTPAFNTFQEYRVKPQAVIHTVERHVYLADGGNTIHINNIYPSNVRFIFEDGKPIDVELIGNE